MPEVGLSPPGFDRQSAADADEDDKQVRFEIGAGDDRDGHKRKNADQQPVDVAPPFPVPVYIGKIIHGKRPPDVNDQQDRNEKPAQQDTAVTGP